MRPAVTLLQYGFELCGVSCLPGEELLCDWGWGEMLFVWELRGSAWPLKMAWS